MSQSPARQTQQKTLVGANIAKIDQSRVSNIQLPVDILSDLQDAFHIFDKDAQDVISIAQFKNILHNFGFGKLPIVDLTADLKRLDADFAKRTSVNFEFLKYAVSYRWNKTGQTEETKDAFKVFDKRDRNFISIQDLKSVFDEYLEVSKTELEEIMAECDKLGNGSISFKEFSRLYNS